MDESMETFVPLTFRRRGVQRVATDERSVHDVTLLDGVARAFYWQHLLDTGAMQSGSAIARAEKLHHSVVNELLRLTLLAPDIIEQFMAGKLRDTMTLAKGLDKDTVEAAALARPRIAELLGGATPKKVIVVPDRLVNIIP